MKKTTENERLKKALEIAAKIMSKDVCPAGYEGNSCPLLDAKSLENSGEPPMCTDETAAECVYDWLLKLSQEVKQNEMPDL